MPPLNLITGGLPENRVFRPYPPPPAASGAEKPLIAPMGSACHAVPRKGGTGLMNMSAPGEYASNGDSGSLSPAPPSRKKGTGGNHRLISPRGLPKKSRSHSLIPHHTPI